MNDKDYVNNFSEGDEVNGDEMPEEGWTLMLIMNRKRLEESYTEVTCSKRERMETPLKEKKIKKREEIKQYTHGFGIDAPEQ